MTTAGITTGTTPLPTTAVPSTTTPLSSTTMPISTGAPSTTTTALPPTTTTTLPPITTTMNYCTQQNGMNQPLTIQPGQVSFDSPSDQSPSSTDINPTSITPGFTFTTPNPRINVTLDQPTTLTVIYLPNDRPNQPSNVKDFGVVFIYPDGSTSQPFTSTTVSTSSAITSTTTPLAGTTPGTTTIVPPSDVSPQVNLPANFDLPQKTTLMIMITSTTNGFYPTGVCFSLFIFITLIDVYYLVKEN